MLDVKTMSPVLFQWHTMRLISRCSASSACCGESMLNKCVCVSVWGSKEVGESKWCVCVSCLGRGHANGGSRQHEVVVDL